MVKILKSAYSELIKHAESGYPNEVCGALIGKDGEITDYKQCRNLNKERSRDRYELDPMSFYEADVWARKKKLEILGIYHSHPDHPSVPSEFDRSSAWSDWIYIIFSINRGKYNDARAWLLDDSDLIFKEKGIDLIDEK
ncbi:MAG: M67 family metallopeptidase [Deltaproteobacteria bacterium]|nr:M67 family metallopeptidase [Deltaproteobacteria bacterium]